MLFFDSFSSRSRKYFMERPSKFQSFIKQITTTTKTARPFRMTKSYSIKRNIFTSAGVLSLLKWGSPSTIIRFIISIVIFSINRMFECGSRSHVFKKCFERIFPLFTNPYSSFAIIMKPFMFGIFTSITHIFPYPIFCGFRKPMTYMGTSARFRFSPSKRIAINNTFVSTNTQAKPLCMIMFIIFCSRNYSKSMKFLTGKVDKFRHGLTSKLRLQAKLDVWQAKCLRPSGSGTLP